jgi:DnaJ domain
MIDKIYRYYESLNLRPDASLEEAKKAYRNLVKEWHPDRFTDNNTLQKEATEKLTKINEAYERIVLHILYKRDTPRIPTESLHEKLQRFVRNKKPIHSFSNIDLVSLLGKSIRSDEVKHYISSLNERPNIEKFGCYYQFKNNGIGLLFNSCAIITISLFSEGFQGHKQYNKTIPCNLKFSDDRQIITRKLGKPSESGRWHDLWNSRQKGEWDKWFLPTHSMYIQYYKDGKISLITLNDKKL